MIMMKQNEIEYYFAKYIENYKHSCFKFIDNSSFDYNALFLRLQLSTKYDCPDAYYIDNVEKKVYIFEHFEVDNSRHSKKGSSIKEKQVNDFKNFIKTANEKSAENDKTEYHSFFKNDSSVNYYFDCLAKSFEKHRQGVKNYKINMLKKLIDDGYHADDSWKFYVSFIIEDTSILGNANYNKTLIFPIFIKEFMDIFRNQNEVDCLFCSNFFNSQCETFILAKEDQYKLINLEEDLSKIKIIEFKSVESFGMSFKISKNNDLLK